MGSRDSYDHGRELAIISHSCGEQKRSQEVLEVLARISGGRGRVTFFPLLTFTQSEKIVLVVGNWECYQEF